MRPATVSRCEATVGNCSIALHDFPVLTCSDPSHPRRHMGPDFYGELIGALYFEKAPISRPKIWQRPICVRCGCVLSDNWTRPDTELAFTMHIKDYPPFGFKLRSRGASCARCGFVQAVVDRELDESLPEAILQVFAAMRIEP